MGSSGRRTHPVMPARPSEAPMTLRNPRRETESTHSEAPLGNSRCKACWNSSLPASSSRERQYSGPVFSVASWAVAASMRSRTEVRSSFLEGQTSSRFLIWIRPVVFFSSFVMRYGLCFFRPFGAGSLLSRATHGLRRGLHSCAASRLGSSSFLPQGLKPPL